MTRRDFITFTTGCLLTGAVAWSTAAINAQKLLLDPVTSIQVCVAKDATLHLIDLTATCPTGQKSLFLKKAEADVDLKDDSGKAQPSNTSATKPGADSTTLADLERRVGELEKLSQLGKLGNRVTAPFVVVNAAGKKVFVVDAGNIGFYNDAGKEVATVSTSDSGSNFIARSGAAGPTVSIGAGLAATGSVDGGLLVLEGGHDRLSVRKTNGHYNAYFYNDAGARIAGIGQSQENAGNVFVADSAGSLRGLMLAPADGKATVSLFNAKTEIATLSQGVSLGGKLTLFGAGGGDPMVEAGSTTDGIGVVRTGPNAFKPGMGVLGLPSSYISGKQ